MNYKIDTVQINLDSVIRNIEKEFLCKKDHYSRGITYQIYQIHHTFRKNFFVKERNTIKQEGECHIMEDCFYTASFTHYVHQKAQRSQPIEDQQTQELFLPLLSDGSP